MLVLMEPQSTESLTVSEDSSQGTSDWGCHPEKSLKRREKNRVAAQRSRKKQTERADVLHEELESLEKQNASYLKEIASLRAELQLYTEALLTHEPLCALREWPPQPSLAPPTLPLDLRGPPPTPQTHMAAHEDDSDFLSLLLQLAGEK
ncbi:basic leucine zipper transcriptional factor ATF-like [Amia ocellicauda]|uniref:basic leucine zipper transcriptional factor ATF-like n=1 Tax=Amia ocellicauda TaxID=2972642 RepID=UPI003464E427